MFFVLHDGCTVNNLLVVVFFTYAMLMLVFQSVGWVHHPNIAWFTITFNTDIRVPQRMNCENVDTWTNFPRVQYFSPWPILCLLLIRKCLTTAVKMLNILSAKHQQVSTITVHMLVWCLCSLTEPLAWL